MLKAIIVAHIQYIALFNKLPKHYREKNDSHKA